MILAIAPATDRRVAHEALALFEEALIIFDGLPLLAINTGHQVQAIFTISSEGRIDKTLTGRTLRQGESHKQAYQAHSCHPFFYHDRVSPFWSRDVDEQGLA
jgi:hypothetical protein